MLGAGRWLVSGHAGPGDPDPVIFPRPGLTSGAAEGYTKADGVVRFRRDFHHWLDDRADRAWRADAKAGDKNNAWEDVFPSQFDAYRAGFAAGACDQLETDRAWVRRDHLQQFMQEDDPQEDDVVPGEDPEIAAMRMVAAAMRHIEDSADSPDAAERAQGRVLQWAMGRFASRRLTTDRR